MIHHMLHASKKFKIRQAFHVKVMADFLSEYCAVILTFDLLTSNLFYHLLMKCATS